MYNSDTELMFPLRVAPQLAGQRGEKWNAIVDQITAQGATTVEQAAFTLLMVRLGGCQGCSVDSFRGMRGCTACAKQTVKRYRGSDSDLETQFVQAQKDIEQHLTKS
ncbi:MAG TPA: hypothetical protein VN364_12025 [Bellilinea sp.]|nr:hypothetical protein [Bellilinea sp.]